ncbi:putative chitinase 2 [Cryptotermes secundus]|uniref:chitinase n=3 Tax=Cryptotermes secundus TaxID=105785 RepID=A0A2J7Q1V0_9NEOP|nr:putative chitinase 2 [Cryptotermes secundus]
MLVRGPLSFPLLCMDRRCCGLLCESQCFNMEARRMTVFVLLLLALISVLADVVAFRGGVGGATVHGRLVVCYVSTWAVYRAGRGSWSLDDLDPTLCTHLVYAFAGLDNRTNTIRSLDEYHDLEDNYGKGTYKKMTALKNRYPHLKVSLAIGGWNEGSANYSIMASNPTSRQTFINSASDFIRKYNFDGLDLDWEYPAKRGGSPADKENFVHLVRELREEFDKHGWLLTAALGVGQDTVDAAYNIPALSRYLDYMHAMCYDLHGSWDNRVGANAPLRSSQPDDKLTVEYAIKYLLKQGAPPRKLVLGLPLYGRTFLLENEENTLVMGAPTGPKGFPGPYTKEDGFMGYNEICVNISDGWKIFWDDDTMTPYAVQGDKVITYDDERSIAEKVKFAMKLDLAGTMVWSVDTDDFRGDCINNSGGGSSNYQLMRTISRTITETLKEKQEQDDQHQTERTTEQGLSAAPKFQAVLWVIVALIVVQHSAAV